MPTPKYDVFLSHSSADKPWVEALAMRLREEGVEPFLDKWHLIPGRPWQEALEKALSDESDSCAVLVGSEGLGPWADEEMRAALDRARADGGAFVVIPVLLPGFAKPGTLPAFLRNRTWVQFRSDGDPDAFHRLLSGIRGKAPGPPAPTPKPTGRSAPTTENWARPWIAQQTELRARLKTETLAKQDTTATQAALREVKGRLRDGPMPTSGEILKDRYELLEMIGEGGFAHVWKAWDEEEDREVAVKILHSQYARSESRLRRFRRGARRMKALRHPGIVDVLADYERDHHFHFFVMEYLDGGDLQHAIREGRIGAGDGLRILHTIGDALHFAHQQDIIHRDIKPANILLSTTGQAKLTDFDLVRALHSAGGTRTATLGTVIYAAPEAMLKAKDADRRADIYGLAMTAAFVLHGQEELPAIVFRNPEGLIRALDVPKAAQEVLCQAVAFEPGDRYASVAEFLEALDEAMRESDAAPASTSATPTTDKSKRRHTNDPLDHLRRILLGHNADGKALRELDSLPELLEKGLPTVPEDRRPQCALEIARAWPKTTDLTELGVLAWTLDYFPGQHPNHEHEALRLRHEVFEELRRKHTPPTREVMSDQLVLIPWGEFLMGAPESEQDSQDRERPQHQVVVTSAFCFLDHPVTNQEYRRLVPEQGGKEDLPVVEVTWYEAYAYSAWLGGRLPTEAEWEYACRAGSTTRYSSGDSEKDLQRVGWYIGNSGNKLHSVKQKEPSAWGLYDMHGNAWEWVADWYVPYSAEKRQDPPGPASGVGRVIRGGCYKDTVPDTRSAFRSRFDPWNRYWSLGFRVVLPVAPEP